jgi:hypothetical protein
MMNQGSQIELILSHLLKGSDEATDSSFKKLSAPTWRALFEASLRHGVAPLLFSRVFSHSPSPIPPDILGKFRMAAIVSAAWSMKLYSDLADLLQLFSRHQIPTIVLKGAHLAAAVYGDVVERPMGDIDLLIHPRDLARSQEILLGMGYGPRTRPPVDVQCTKGHQLIPFEFNSTSIDVHWNIEDNESPFNIELDGLWKRAQQIDLVNVPTLALSPEDLLLHISLHASYNHGWLMFSTGLRSLYDIKQIIAHYGDKINWDSVRRRISEWHVGKSIYLTLRLADEILGCDIPRDVLDALRPRAFNPKFLSLARDLLFGDHYSRFTESFPTMANVQLSKRSLKRNRPKFLVECLFKSREWLANDYPNLTKKGLAFLTPVVRWADLVRDGTLLYAFPSENARAIRRAEKARLELADWLESA